MLTSFAPTPGALAADPTGQQKMHSTKDVYNTGLSKSLSGLATSHDGVHWNWQGAVLEPQESGWDCYAARLNTAVWLPPLWIGYYDGSARIGIRLSECTELTLNNNVLPAKIKTERLAACYISLLVIPPSTQIICPVM